MTIDTPSALLVLNDASGTTIVNDGADADWTISGGAETTDWAWHTGAGSYDGYFESKRNASGMPYATTAQATPGTTLNTYNFACRFNLTGPLNNGNAFILGPHGSQGFLCRCVTPAGSGNFDLNLRWQASSGDVKLMTWAGLTFSTDYAVAGSVNPSTPSATVTLGLLGATAPDGGQPANINITGATWANEWPYFLRGPSFNNLQGFLGLIYYWAYQRGGNAWTATDIQNINTAPKTYLPGWPGGGPTTVVPIFTTNYMTR